MRAPVRAVFLDRDGVLNKAYVKDGKPIPPQNLDEFIILNGVHEGTILLRAAGLILVVVTNQPDIARGRITLKEVNEFNAILMRELPLSEIFMCPHDDCDGCKCRKPKPGLLIEASHKLGIDLAQSFMIGDRWRDVEAGYRAGCRTIFMDRGYSEPAPRTSDYVTTDFLAAATWIMAAVKAEATRALRT